MAEVYVICNKEKQRTDQQRKKEKKRKKHRKEEKKAQGEMRAGNATHSGTCVWTNMPMGFLHEEEHTEPRHRQSVENKHRVLPNLAK